MGRKAREKRAAKLQKRIAKLQAKVSKLTKAGKSDKGKKKGAHTAETEAAAGTK